MQSRKYPVFILLSLFLSSCNTGYQKEGGVWVWVTNDENFGRRSTYIVEADTRSFEVLSVREFAKDKNHVYRMGKVIRDADPQTFALLADKGYGRDKKYVFLDTEKVLFADPHSFELLQYPYSKDRSHLYCGILPVEIPKHEIGKFKVTNEDKTMAGMKSTILLKYFIEFNPSYAWLDTMGIEAVIVGEWATGETPTKKVKGFKVTEKLP